MTASAGYLDLLRDLLAPLGAITVRRMFGGAGVYCDGAVFAFVDEDTLFLKTDEAGRGAFEAEGMRPFVYMTKDGPGTLLSYWRAPERLIEDQDEMCEWARRAIGVSRRAAARKQKAVARPRGKKSATSSRRRASRPEK